MRSDKGKGISKKGKVPCGHLNYRIPDFDIRGQVGIGYRGGIRGDWRGFELIKKFFYFYCTVYDNTYIMAY